MNNCYPSQTAAVNNDTNTNISIDYNKNYIVSGKLTEDLISQFKTSAEKYNIDWRWLATIASMESGLNPKQGCTGCCCGMFEFARKYWPPYPECGTTNDFNNWRKQSDCTALIFKKESDIVKNKYKCDDETSNLYALCSHNAGNAAAAFFMQKTSVKNINSLIYTIKTVPQSEFSKSIKGAYSLDKSAFKKGGPIKRDEIINYMIKGKSIYMSLCKKYK